MSGGRHSRTRHPEDERLATVLQQTRPTAEAICFTGPITSRHGTVQRPLPNSPVSLHVFMCLMLILKMNYTVPYWKTFTAYFIHKQFHHRDDRRLIVTLGLPFVSSAYFDATDRGFLSRFVLLLVRPRPVPAVRLMTSRLSLPPDFTAPSPVRAPQGLVSF